MTAGSVGGTSLPPLTTSTADTTVAAPATTESQQPAEQQQQQQPVAASGGGGGFLSKLKLPSLGFAAIGSALTGAALAGKHLPGPLKAAGLFMAGGGAVLAAFGMKSEAESSGRAIGQQEGYAVGTQDGQQAIIGDANAIITEQQASIDRLTKENEQLKGGGAPVDGDPEATTDPADPETQTQTTETTQAGLSLSPAQLLGQALPLGGASTKDGVRVAQSGVALITRIVGDPNGYDSVEAAEQAMLAAVAPEEYGTDLLRWMVVETSGRFVAVAGELDEESVNVSLGDQGAAAVTSWTALKPETSGRYIQYLHGVAGDSLAWFDPSSTSGTAAIDQTAGTGGASTASWNPNVAINATVVVGAAAENGYSVPGGHVQLQALVPGSEQGFATTDEAANAIRAARGAATGANQHARWMSIQGPDGRIYAYSGSLVSGPGAVELGGGAMLNHLFGPGFVQYYDGSAWRVTADS